MPDNHNQLFQIKKNNAKAITFENHSIEWVTVVEI